MEAKKQKMKANKQIEGQIDMFDIIDKQLNKEKDNNARKN